MLHFLKTSHQAVDIYAHAHDILACIDYFVHLNADILSAEL